MKSARAAMHTWEGALSLVAFAILAATIANPTWIERAFHLDPDAGSGLAEWAVVATWFLIAGFSGRRAWRRVSVARGSSPG